VTFEAATFGGAAIGMAHPGFEAPGEIVDDHEHARSDVCPEQAQERIDAFRRMNRDRHPGNFCFCGVVPEVPVDADPSVAASDGHRVEHRVRP
jgi:hypothetical protein